jgi:hypothetical protein
VKVTKEQAAAHRAALVRASAKRHTLAVEQTAEVGQSRYLRSASCFLVASDNSCFAILIDDVVRCATFETIHADLYADS